MTNPPSRPELLGDTAYFAGELCRRLALLADLEPDGRLTSTWQQLAALARRVRGVLREQQDRERRHRRLERIA